MEKRYKNLLSNSILFLIANFGSKLISFILVPYYTHVLSTAEYGTVDILVATVSLLSPIVTFGIGDVITMYLVRREVEESEILTNSTIIIILGNILVCIVYPFLLLSETFKEYIFQFIFLTILTSLYAILQSYVRGIGRVKAFAFSGIMYTAVLAVCNILFLLVFKLGITGYLLSMIFAYIVPVLFLLSMIDLRQFNISKFDKKLIREIMILSIPLIPNAVLWWLMNISDKYAISFFLGLAMNGIYSVAHKLPSIISVVYSIFQQAWQLTTFELSEKEERSVVYTNIFELLTGVLFVSSSFLLILGRIYVEYFCEKTYLEAWLLIPILLYSAIFNSLSGFLGSSYILMKNTKGALRVTTVGVLINVVLNLIFVQLFGLVGAAVATCIGFAYMSVKKYLDTREFVEIKFNKIRFLSANLLIVIGMISVMIKNTTIYYGVNVVIVLAMLVNYKGVMEKVLEKIYSGLLHRKEKK